MFRLHSRLMAGVAASAFALVPGGPAWAAEAETRAPETADDADAGGGAIIVTATKREADIQDVPVTVTAAGGELLAKLELRTAIDVSRIAPNTNAWGTESRQRPRWFIRGIAAGAVKG